MWSVQTLVCSMLCRSLLTLIHQFHPQPVNSHSWPENSQCQEIPANYKTRLIEFDAVSSTVAPLRSHTGGCCMYSPVLQSKCSVLCTLTVCFYTFDSTFYQRALQKFFSFPSFHCFGVRSMTEQVDVRVTETKYYNTSYNITLSKGVQALTPSRDTF